MVGGKISKITNLPSKLILQCVDNIRPHETTSVTIERSELSDKITIGDQLWWQNKKVFWSSQDKKYQDHPFNKIGYSYTN